MNYKLKKMTLQVAAAFLIIAAVSGVLFYSNREAAQEILSVYIPKMESMMSEDGTISTVSLFFNNLFACAMCIGMGVIPFLFLTIWAIVSNAMIIGAVLGLGSSMGTMSWFNAVVFGMLPHGIFELPAVFFSMAMGIYLCQTLTGKIFGKNREEKILPMLNTLAKNFVVIVIPLLIIAAIVETTITPMILNAFGMN